MLRRISYLALFCSLALSFSACSRRTSEPTAPPAPTSPAGPATQTPGNSVKFVKAAASAVEIPAGGEAEAVVKLSIQNGYHVNANPPTYPYLRATEVVVQTGDGVSVGFITYPNSLNKKFSFAEKPLSVYEGEAAIKVMLKAARSAPKGTRSLPAKVNVQACDDQVCYAPGTLELSIPVTIK